MGDAARSSAAVVVLVAGLLTGCGDDAADRPRGDSHVASEDALGLEWTVFDEVGFVDELVTDGDRFLAIGQTVDSHHWLAAWDETEGFRVLEFSDPAAVAAVRTAALSDDRVGATILPVDEAGWEAEAVIALGALDEPLDIHVLPRPPEPVLVGAGAETITFEESGVVVHGTGVVASGSPNSSVALRWLLSDGAWSVAVVDPPVDRSPPLDASVHRMAEGGYGTLRVLPIDAGYRHRLELETAGGDERSAASADLPGATEPGWWYGVGNDVGVLDDGIVVSMVEVPTEGEEGEKAPARRWVLLIGRDPAAQ